VVSPRRDDAIWKVSKQNLGQELDNLANNPEFAFASAALSAEWANHPRMTLPTSAEVAKIDLDKAFAFYKDRFADAAGFTFVIVGVVDLEQLRPLVETYLASLPSHGHKDKEKDLGIRRVRGVVKQQWQLGTEPKAIVQLEFHGDETWTREKERDMRMLGHVVSVRLRDTLREGMGGIYTLTASGRITRVPPQERTFTIKFGCDPARVDELIAATLDQVAKLQKEGVGDDQPAGAPQTATGGELTKLKQTFMRSHETEVRRNSYWTRTLLATYRFGDDPMAATDPKLVTDRATSTNIQASAKRYLDTKQYFQAVMVPKAATPAANQ
jgi:zinc protease